jgi:hypothetical protein
MNLRAKGVGATVSSTLAVLLIHDSSDPAIHEEIVIHELASESSRKGIDQELKGEPRTKPGHD